MMLGLFTYPFAAIHNCMRASLVLPASHVDTFNQPGQFILPSSITLHLKLTSVVSHQIGSSALFIDSCPSPLFRHVSLRPSRVFLANGEVKGNEREALKRHSGKVDLLQRATSTYSN